EYAAHQPPDGYTLMVTQSTLASAAAFKKSLGFDPIADFAPISIVANTPLALAVPSQSTVKSIGDLVTLAKAKRVTYGTPGPGSPQHLFVVLLASKSGIEMTNVAYRGSAAVAVAVGAGEIDMGVAPVVTIAPHVQSGRVRAIAVTDPNRSALLPGVPTAA